MSGGTGLGPARRLVGAVVLALLAFLVSHPVVTQPRPVVGDGLAGSAPTTVATRSERPHPSGSTSTVPPSDVAPGVGPSAGTPPAAAPAPASADAPRPPTIGGSADRLLLWVRCDDVAGLEDAELDRWHARGVDGFVCQTGHLHGMGGAHAFTASRPVPGGEAYGLQRQIMASHIVERARARGMTMHLGVYLANYYNHRTPLREWFDDGGWRSQVLPGFAQVAGAARSLGFAGLALDEELYPQQGGAETASWRVDYHGAEPSRTAATVRRKVGQRGAELMAALVRGFPGLEIVDYGARFPEGWGELVQQEVNGIRDAYRGLVHLDFWAGMTSVPGHGRIRFLDAVFYKSTHVRDATWDTALGYNTNRLMALFSRSFPRWDDVASQVSVSPFAWISAGPGRYETARPVDYVAEQLEAFRLWGMDGAFANFAYGGLDRFDYGPYEAAMRAASRPGTVDGSAPALTVGGVARSDGGATVTGTSRDDRAIRVVTWSVNGSRGPAAMSWVARSGSPSTGYDWEVRWSTGPIPVPPGTRVAITTEDIKGLVTTAVVTV